MVFEAKDELRQYLSSINNIYADYTERLWANEVNSISMLGDASLTDLQAFGVENPMHARNIIAHSDRIRQGGPQFQLYDKLIAVQMSCAQAPTL